MYVYSWPMEKTSFDECQLQCLEMCLISSAFIPFLSLRSNIKYVLMLGESMSNAHFLSELDFLCL